MKVIVEVFATNVQEACEARDLMALLTERFPDVKVNFDLDDPDKILRVEGANVTARNVEMIIMEKGFICEALI